MQETQINSDGLKKITDFTYVHATNIKQLYLLGQIYSQKTVSHNGKFRFVEGYTVNFNKNLTPWVNTYYRGSTSNIVEQDAFSYDTYGNVLSVSKRLFAGNDTSISFDYDDDGRITDEVDILGKSIAYFYNEFGLCDRIVDTRNNVTDFIYDSFGRETQQKFDYRLIDITKYEWSTNSEPELYKVTENKSTEAPTVRFFDALNQEVARYKTTFDGSVRKVKYEYDRYGNLVRESCPYVNSNSIRWNTYAYDSCNRPTKISLANGKETTYEYLGAFDISHRQWQVKEINPKQFWTNCFSREREWQNNHR